MGRAKGIRCGEDVDWGEKNESEHGEAGKHDAI